MSESPFSAIHWHPARFASQLPATVIGLLTRPGDLVCDPFMGSGTALVEAQRLDRPSIGIDLNPISCLMARSKTAAIPATKVNEIIQEIKAEATSRLSELTRKCPLTTPPKGVQQKWYTEPVREDLTILWNLILQFKSLKATIAQAAFSAILLPVCRETRHWGYVCDNTAPKSHPKRDVLEGYTSVLDRLCNGYAERDKDRTERLGKLGDIEKAAVICGDVSEVLETLPENSIKLVVTSPPYEGVSDYTKSQRLSMEWFGIEIEKLRLKEIGARSKRHRISALGDYLTSLRKAFTRAKHCLRKDGFCVVIVGESSARDSTVAKVSSEIVSCGMHKELDLNRTVSSQRRQAPSITGEHLLVFSK